MREVAPWYFDPQSGGTPIPPKIQEETRVRILNATEKMKLKNVSGFDIRFKKQFCYIDAYESGNTIPTHLCRLRYFSGRGENNNWSFAFYMYSHERYEPCVFQSGEWFGSSEQALEASSIYLT